MFYDKLSLHKFWDIGNWHLLKLSAYRYLGYCAVFEQMFLPNYLHLCLLVVYI